MDYSLYSSPFFVVYNTKTASPKGPAVRLIYLCGDVITQVFLLITISITNAAIRNSHKT